ncbi:MAG: BamA/TamA family outer membrane protein [Elainellaceae cyanobacterium]
MRIRFHPFILASLTVSAVVGADPAVQAQPQPPQLTAAAGEILADGPLSSELPSMGMPPGYVSAIAAPLSVPIVEMSPAEISPAEISPVKTRPAGEAWRLANLAPPILAQTEPAQTEPAQIESNEPLEVEQPPAPDTDEESILEGEDTTIEVEPREDADPQDVFDTTEPRDPAIEIELDGSDPLEQIEETFDPDDVPADEDAPAAEEPEADTPEPEDQPRLQIPSDEAEIEVRVLVAEVQITGLDGRPELEQAIEQLRETQQLQTQPGRTTTRSQLQSDINAIFSTGFFTNVQAVPEDTPLGVRITFALEPNPILREVDIVGSELADQDVALAYTREEVDEDGNTTEVEVELEIEQLADAIFENQYGTTLNLLDFQEGINELGDVYENNGYVLAQVLDARQVSDSGVAVLEVAEGVIEDIEVKFLDEDGLDRDEDGEPVEGRTRDFIITREFETQPGDVFNQQEIQEDLQQVFGLGIFDDVRVTLEPGDDPRNVDVVVNVIEGRTGSLAAGLGFSSSSGIFGSVSYQQQNLGGNNQRLGAELQIGEREFLFDVRFTDPWIAGDPFRTSYTVNAFSRRSISLIFDGGEDDVDLPNGDSPRVQRLGGAVSFSRPLNEWLGWDDWRASTGVQFQRVSIRDSDGELEPEDEFGNDLSFDGDGTDDLFTLQLGAVRDRRNNPQQPTSGSLLRVGSEQSIPIGDGSIFFNRLRGSYSFYLPASLTDFTDGPEAFAFNVQAGTVIGDLPPYEAFSLGGTDSVRGFDAGDLAGGRSFVQATAEYRFPIFSIVGGALFVDFGSDLGTGSDVPGEPAEVRDKPGTGFGYGLGVRVNSPLGAIRVDYGINDDGDGRIHFGIGERF